MKKYNQGTTILEVLVSIILISTIVGLLFGLLIRIQEDDEENNLNSSFLLAESTIEKTVPCNGPLFQFVNIQGGNFTAVI